MLDVGLLLIVVVTAGLDWWIEYVSHMLLLGFDFLLLLLHIFMYVPPMYESLSFKLKKSLFDDIVYVCVRV